MLLDVNVVWVDMYFVIRTEYVGGLRVQLIRNYYLLIRLKRTQHVSQLVR